MIWKKQLSKTLKVKHGDILNQQLQGQVLVCFCDEMNNLLQQTAIS